MNSVQLDNLSTVETLTENQLAEVHGGADTTSKLYVAGGVATAGIVQSGLLGPFGPIITSVINDWQPPTLLAAKFKVGFQDPALGIEYLKQP
jgi:hypothetical protein